MAYYRLLALDIDGTLIGPDQIVAPDVVEAVGQAEAAGLRVCLATGRSFNESIGIWRQLRLPATAEPMVLVGGALVAEPQTGRTIYQRSIPREIACRFADALGGLGYAAMALVDRWRHEVDYFLTETGDLAAASRDWFDKMDARVRRLGRLAEMPASPDVLRISAVAGPDEARAVADELGGLFDGGLNVQAICAPNYGVTIVEAHSVEATKLAALKYVAQARRIGPGRIVAVGDDVNDVSMVGGVGLGVAMPSAPPVLLDAADQVASDGLAALIRQLVAGRFDPPNG
jgi:HAD superfamily hydrolase (TIGR01484 family)